MASNGEAGTARGLLICPICLEPTLVRLDTISFGVPARSGATLRRKVYRCTAMGCPGRITTAEISEGLTTKSYLRDDSANR